MSDHIPGTSKMVCVHCGLPADRQQNGIQGYRCGSSFCRTFNVQWARSMTCLELQNGQLQERLKRLEEAGDKLTPGAAAVLMQSEIEEWTAAKEAKP
jgi:hypothetical protein